MEIVSTTIKITTPIMPPEVDYIENEIKKQGLDPLRWAIINVTDNELTLSVSGKKY